MIGNVRDADDCVRYPRHLLSSKPSSLKGHLHGRDMNVVPEPTFCQMLIHNCCGVPLAETPIANGDGSPIVTVEAPLDAFRAVWKLNAIVAGFCPACDGAAFVAIQTTTPSEAVLSENAHYLAPVLLLVMFH